MGAALIVQRFGFQFSGFSFRFSGFGFRLSGFGCSHLFDVNLLGRVRREGVGLAREGNGQDAILVLGTHLVLGVGFEELVILVVV